MPRDLTPNANGPGPNTPPQSVGPTSSEGIGNTNVMYDANRPAPPEVQAWSGWPVDWQTPEWGPDFSGTGYGRQGNSTNVATAMTCVDLNSRQLASFPTYGLKGDTPFTLPDWAMNSEPEMYSCWSEMMHEAVNSFQLRGETFFYVTGRYHNGWPSRFVVLNPDVIDVEWIDGRRVYTLGGGDVDPADVLQVKFQSWPGRMRGISPLEWASRSLITSGALEKYASELAAKGGIPWGVFSVPGELKNGQAKEFRDTWISSRLDAMGAPGVLSGGASLQTLTFSPRDMALLELREFDERRICAAFGVPAFLVNVAMASNMTYSNVDQVFDFHWRATLRTMANTLAQALSAWLLPRGQVLEFNPDRYVQPSIEVRAQTWAALNGITDEHGRPAMSVAEIRSAERLAPLPDEPSDTPVSPDDNLDAQRLTGRIA